MSQQIVQRLKTGLVGDLEGHLERLVVKVGLVRLFFLVLLIFPMCLAWWRSNIDSYSYYDFFLQLPYSIFLVLGFAVTIFFLNAWSRFSNILLIFRLQLYADIFLTVYLCLLTGGVASNFFFLFPVIVFLYGRILGMKAAYKILAVVILFLLIISLGQSLFPIPLIDKLTVYQSSYYFFLQLLALSLILLLLRVSFGQENYLFDQIADQEKKLEYSEKVKFQVFDWMPSALMVLDREGSISLINKKALEMAGVDDLRQVIGRPVEQFFPELSAVWKNWDKKESLRTEVKKNDQRTILGATFTPVAEEEKDLIFFKDITKIKDLENQVKQMERLANLGQLSAGLAHEIKNPLAGIKASLQLLSKNNLSTEQESKLQKVIQRDIQRLDRLISDFLVFARPGSGDKQMVSLVEVLEDCLNYIRLEYPNVSLTIENSLSGLQWFWDPDQLNQVLLNILLNAAQATREVQEASIYIGQGQDRKGEFLFVLDNGKGIDPEIKRYIFDPFVTSKNKGIGLGLSIAQRLANQNDSWIEINNRSQNGTEVRIYGS